MTEDQLQDKIVDLAHTLGWKAAHFRARAGKTGRYRTPCQYDAEGYPDLHLIHPATGDEAWAEVKIWARRNAGTPEFRAKQERWKAWLEAAGHPVPLWTERDEAEYVERLTRPTKVRVA